MFHIKIETYKTYYSTLSKKTLDEINKDVALIR